MKKYIKACKFWAGLFSAPKNKRIWKLLFHYGDWCAPDMGYKDWMKRGKWTGTACLAHSSGIVSEIAGVLGETEEAEEYMKLSQETARAYRNILMDENCHIKGGDFQTAFVLPLYYNMLSGNDKKKTAANLVNLIRDNNYNIKTGFPGTPYVLFALADNGYLEDAYKMLLADTCPSWLYEVKAGATTMWERWDALREDGSLGRFQRKIHVLNPKQVKKFKEAYPDLPKNDFMDAFVIADHLRFGRIAREVYMDDYRYQALRTLTRARFDVIQNLTREKQRFANYLFLKCSGIAQDKGIQNTSATTIALMEHFETVDDLANADLEELTAFITKTGRGRFAAPVATAKAIRAAARGSYRLPKTVNNTVNQAMAVSIASMQALEKQVKVLDKAIEHQFEIIPNTDVYPRYWKGLFCRYHR